ncbi:MAG: xanthine dehydrogenase family protein molybdopterin-binding subunit [Gammaproteobacteria bacterium]|nr:xanthine dehydrogenase family protein molybdopterin-binding subunit [Gammaproteobacteria bacterium]
MRACRAVTSIGSSVERTDSAAKVRGETVYAIDRIEAGMLHGQLLRSPVPAGSIIRLETARARAVPGVRAVITAADVPDVLAGWFLRDTPLFARKVVRYAGEPVAAVAADTLEAARAAVQALELVLEEHEAIHSIEDALRTGAALVHPEWRTYQFLPGGEWPRAGNVATRSVCEVGDVASAFRRAHRVVEDTFSSNRQFQAFLEARSAIGICRGGRYVVHTGHQYPFNVRDRIAQFLDLPQSWVRVCGHALGGGFGGKLDYGLEPYAAVLSRFAGGRPVRLAHSFAEDLAAAGPRDNSIITIRSALDASGAIIGREFRADLDNGAYTGEMLAMPGIAANIAGAVYRVGAARVESNLVYTNTPPTGAFRGVSGVAMYTALERHMDHIARELGVDRREYRLRHLLAPGDALLSGQVLPDAGILREAFDAVERIAPWAGLSNRRQPWRGVGIGACVWVTNPGPASVTLKLNEDGTVAVLSGAIEIGSGSFAAGVTQLVAEELGLRPTDVVLPEPDTDVAAYDSGSQGSRTVRMIGGAARAEARQLRAQILERAAHLLQAGPDDLELGGGAVRRRDAAAGQVPLALVAAADLFQAGPIAATARYAEPPPAFDPTRSSGALMPAFPGVSYHVHLAEVEVDPVTGTVRVLRYVVAQEVGRAINPANIRGQIQGGVAQGIGLTLHESLRMERGHCVERSMATYRLPLSVDVPDVEVVLLEHPDPQAPHGIRGVAEAPIVLVPAVIGNAVADAIGQPVHATPITPEEILRLIMAGEADPVAAG